MAIDSLQSLLVPSFNKKRHVYAPPAVYLALIFNLAIHPFSTTNPPDSSWHDVSSHALNYLHALLDIVGPLNLPFHEAFKFSFRHNISSPPMLNHLNDCLGTMGSVWHLGEDFWDVVGWAFYCCTIPDGSDMTYTKRWNYWFPWLEFFVDLLEQDYKLREAKDEALNLSSNGTSHDCKHVQNSIFASYINTQRVRHSKGAAYVLSAILAGLTSKPSPFLQVFHNETHITKKRKRTELTKVDLDEYQFGDWLNEDEFSGSESSLTWARSRHRLSEKIVFSKSGAVEVHDRILSSISLRFRLFTLLYHYMKSCPETNIVFGMNFYDLHFKLAVDYVKHFSIEIFQTFLGLGCENLDHASQTTIIQILFRAMLAKEAEQPSQVIHAGTDNNSITQPILEQCYLPYAAVSQSLDENLRISLLLEYLVQNLWDQNSLLYSENLRNAVEVGVKARKDHIQAPKCRKKKVPRDLDAILMKDLLASGERLYMLVEMLRHNCILDAKS